MVSYPVYMHTPIKRITLVVTILVLLGGGFFTSYYVGYLKGTDTTRHIVVEGISDPQDANTAEFAEFWDVWNLLKEKYVSKEKVSDNQKLLEGAISGLVASVDDPHTVFFPPQEADDFTQEISGQFGGIGAEIGMNEQKELIVVAPLKNSPAQRMGIRSGDKIIQIDGQDTFGLSTDEAVKKIRGKKGTKVTLTLRRGQDPEQKLQITRDIIQVPTVDFEKLNAQGKRDEKGDIAYIRLYNFYEKSPALFQDAALKARAMDAQKIIIDLRDNPGGYLDAGVNIAGWFIEKGKLVVTEDFQDASKSQKFSSQGPALFKDAKVVVLINKGSASASEILAGALKEAQGASIMGEKSFGKGTVQELIPIKNDAMVKITIAHWITPQGHQIDKNGITPDIELKTDTSTSILQGIDADQWISAAAHQVNK